MKTILTCIALLSIGTLSGQSKFKNTSFEVDGLCGMCEKRIENAAYIQGVKKADWSKETHMLTLIYNSNKVDETSIIAAVNEAGHDVKNHLATETQYDNIHGCCRYRDPNQRAKHGLGDPICTPNETQNMDEAKEAHREH